jgi:formiminotetrahydrofolate cyclodeaminase
MAKASRVTLRHQVVASADRVWLEAVLQQARAQRAELMRLAEADQEAYGAVLETLGATVQEPMRRRAWQVATEVPLHVAEVCRRLLDLLPRLLAGCWPAFRVDLETGGWLLELAVRAGLLAAESNLRAWGGDAEVQPLRARMENLRESET